VPAADNPYLRQLGGRLGVRRLLEMTGYDVVRRHYYSPVPDVKRLAEEAWSVRSDLRGVKFDIAAGLRFLQEELAPFIAEYRPPLTSGSDPRQFYLENGFYEGLDAETLFAMVRHVKPDRVIELGSGFSTLVIADARARNDASVTPMGHEVYDPHPPRQLLPVFQDLAAFRQLTATQISLDVFAALKAGDMLFVDTTHTVKIGSEVNRIVLDVLPLLARGVYVHFHDIFLPWEYPREFVLERRFYWAEQYLLQAFLAFNHEYEVLFGTHALKRTYPEAIQELVPSSALSRWPSAFWLRRVDESRG
jgi:hypothetical protein